MLSVFFFRLRKCKRNSFIPEHMGKEIDVQVRFQILSCD